MKNLKNILDGIKQALVLDYGDKYVRPTSSDFSIDVSTLRRDSQIVISDLNKTTKKHVKQIPTNKS